MADNGVREYLGGEFEIQLDDMLSLDHWTSPPLFVEIADPLLLRRELRGLLRGQLVQSPMLVGRALGLIGADLGVMVQLTEIEVREEDIDRDSYTAVVERNVGGPGQPRRGEPGAVMDTVRYATVSGELVYYVKADIVLVDDDGRELTRFEASSRRGGPFQRGEFEGDPRVLDLDQRRAAYFDPAVLSEQTAAIEGAMLTELAAAIAVGTYDQVLAGIR
jgi:hypothetical protein